MTDKTYKYSEIFHSFQGEGALTGRSTAWIRFFLCNLQCDGFGQKDPTDPSTYILPYETFDASTITKVEDLPVFEYGCDSSYTWSKKFKHLMHDDTPSRICDKLEQALAHSTNPEGFFCHPETHMEHHMAFTGGEPMLKQNQKAILAILQEMENRDNIPYYFTTETNGTQKLTDEMVDCIRRLTETDHKRWFWSISPKLWSTAGENPTKAIIPDVVSQYHKANPYGQLKYVVNGTQESWDEVEKNTELFYNAGARFPVYIMAVGATKEEQENEQIANIAMEAMKRGYHFSGRLHAHIFGNEIGT